MIDLEIIEVCPGKNFSLGTLKRGLPTVESALFFAKLYKLDAQQLGNLLLRVFDSSDVVNFLVNEPEGHSSKLQDYLLELGFEYLINIGAIEFGDKPVHGEILPEMWESLELQIAESIQEVGDALVDVVDHMPGIEGAMIFTTLMDVNARRPILGTHKASIYHAPTPDNLVVMDTSGSMSEHTVKGILADSLALSHKAKAHFAIVSDTCTVWGPGEATVEAVLAAAEYQGTHYETLAALMDQKWGVVVTIADYDSSIAAKPAIASRRGSIELLLDISLVGRPTFLAEVLGQKAAEVRPLLIARHNLAHGW